MRRTALTALAVKCTAAGAAGVAGLAITGMTMSGHPARTTTAVSSGPPRYYADIEGSESVVIRATATGRVTDTYVYASGSIGAVTAARDDRTFYFVEDALSTATVKTFRITASGKITGLHSVRGGTISTHAGLVDSIAVSPDGSRLAAGEFFDPSPGGGGPVADLIVISLRTGKQTVWQGIRKKNWPVSIPSVSWTADGRSVVYLLQWCSHGLEGTDTCFGAQYAEVWSLDPGSHGGALASHGRRLLAQSARYPVIQQALASSRTGAVIVMVLSGKQDTHLAIDLVSVPAGKTLTVLYRGVAGEAAASSLSADGSRTCLLLADGFGAHHGWIHGGHLHLLPPTNGDGEPMTW
jgi:hypothetical protein